MTAPAQEAVITPTKRDQKFMEPFIMIIICICFSSPARLIRRVNIQKRIKVFPLKKQSF